MHNGNYVHGHPSESFKAQAQCQPGPSPQPTLARAMSRAEELEKRLVDLHTRVEGLATRLGGPRPQDPQEGKTGTLQNLPDVVALNEIVDASHLWLSRIEHALIAVGHSLG